MTPDRIAAREMLADMPLYELGKLAFAAKQARFGDVVTYTVNRHINPTNLCVHSCKFCDFAAKPRDSHAYILDEPTILQSIEAPELNEVHIVGGLWPNWGLERSLRLVREIRRVRPDLWIKAFTAVEIAFFAKLEGLTTREVLLSCKDAGVDALPGGGAEVLNDRIHQALYADKIGPSEWLAIHGESHEVGLPTNCTLLFGHIETDDEIIDHLLALREQQARTGGFDAFIPLAYQPGKTLIVPRMASPERCLRIIAVSRLLLDNIPHIKAYWPTLQVETAAIALNFGADDLDGTLGIERIMQLAQTQAPAGMTPQRLEQIVRDAGQVPMRRDGSFRHLGAAQQAAALAS